MYFSYFEKYNFLLNSIIWSKSSLQSFICYNFHIFDIFGTRWTKSLTIIGGFRHRRFQQMKSGGGGDASMADVTGKPGDQSCSWPLIHREVLIRHPVLNSAKRILDPLDREPSHWFSIEGRCREKENATPGERIHISAVLARRTERRHWRGTERGCFVITPSREGSEGPGAVRQYVLWFHAGPYALFPWTLATTASEVRSLWPGRTGIELPSVVARMSLLTPFHVFRARESAVAELKGEKPLEMIIVVCSIFSLALGADVLF